MNCIAEALPYLDQPGFSVGCCIPDWLPGARDQVYNRASDLLPFYPLPV